MTVATHDNRGSWAGGRRDYTAAMKYAYGLLLEGKPYSFAANAAGVPTDALRTLWPDMGRKDPIPEPQVKRPISFRPPAPRKAMDLISDVAAEYEVSVDDLFGRINRREVVFARAEAYSRISKHMGWSSQKIARLFGRDASTVRAGLILHANRTATIPVGA